MRTALSEKEDRLISVQKSLDRERDEKMSLLEEKTRDEMNWMTEKNQWQIEKQEMKLKLSELLETAESNKNVKLKEAETNEINQAYHKVIKDKESLENENSLLKQEVKRLQMIISSPNDFDQIRSSVYGGEEDFGYSSHKNTLEKQHRKNGSVSNTSSSHSEGEFYSLQNSHHSNLQNNISPPTTFERKIKSFFGFNSTSRISEGKKVLIPSVVVTLLTLN